MSFCSCFGHTQLRETDSLPRPVVLVEAEDAEELMGLVNKNEEAKVRIEIMMEQPRWVSTETNAHTHASDFPFVGRNNSRTERESWERHFTSC